METKDIILELRIKNESWYAIYHDSFLVITI